MLTRRQFLPTAALASAASVLLAQERGARPDKLDGVTLLNPRGRVPLSIIVDDSTCLVNLNKFAIPQFAEANPGQYDHYNWREWPSEIPDSFVRKFGEWAAKEGVKGKYSIVPFPACVGRLDHTLPGWTQGELKASLDLVRTLLMPNWDIHPEMVTHTRIIDPKTGHPFPEFTRKYMENWDWTTDRSADEIAEYMHYALTILKNVGLPCEGVTTPGGFGNRARPQLAQATLDSCRSAFGAEIPHYFRDLHDSGDKSVQPRVELAADLDSDDPRCVVSIVGCTGDWTGGWDNSLPDGADKFITKDGTAGRMVEVIRGGEPAIIVCHWTGIYFNGRELGFQIFREVVARLKEHFGPRTQWMKLSEISRHWAAKELTTLTRDKDGTLHFQAPFACPEFTLSLTQPTGSPHMLQLEKPAALQEVDGLEKLAPGTWHRAHETLTLCFALPKGRTSLKFS